MSQIKGDNNSDQTEMLDAKLEQLNLNAESNNQVETKNEHEEFITKQLRQSPKDRLFMLNIEKDVLKFLNEKKNEAFKFTAMNPYHRMLTHRIADYFNLGHSLDQTRQSVIIFHRSDNNNNNLSLSKLKSFQSIISSFNSNVNSSNEQSAAFQSSSSTSSESTPTQHQQQLEVTEKKQILKREIQNNVNSTTSNANSFSNQKTSTIKTFEEKSAEYMRIKDRIFNNNSDNNNGNVSSTQAQKQPPNILNRKTNNNTFISKKQTVKTQNNQINNMPISQQQAKRQFFSLTHVAPISGAPQPSAVPTLAPPAQPYQMAMFQNSHHPNGVNGNFLVNPMAFQMNHTNNTNNNNNNNNSSNNNAQLSGQFNHVQLMPSNSNSPNNPLLFHHPYFHHQNHQLYPHPATMLAQPPFALPPQLHQPPQHQHHLPISNPNHHHQIYNNNNFIYQQPINNLSHLNLMTSSPMITNQNTNSNRLVHSNSLFMANKSNNKKAYAFNSNNRKSGLYKCQLYNMKRDLSKKVIMDILFSNSNQHLICNVDFKYKNSNEPKGDNTLDDSLIINENEIQVLVEFDNENKMRKLMDYFNTSMPINQINNKNINVNNNNNNNNQIMQPPFLLRQIK